MNKTGKTSAAQSKNLFLGDPEKFKKALDEIIEENKEGLNRLGKY